MIDQLLPKDKIHELLVATAEGPVFGPGIAFNHPDSPELTPHVATAAELDVTMGRVASYAGALGMQLYGCLQEALPDVPKRDVAARTVAILAKAACFAAALAPELEDDQKLTWAALAIGLMYATDEGMDRGDMPTQLAVEQAYGDGPVVIPEKLETAVADRTKLLDHMRATIMRFAREGDGEFVLSCYADAVLRNEAALQRLSDTYAELPEEDQKAAFLEAHAEELATRMVEDAGVQSVTASLETQYPHDDGDPLLAEVHADPRMQEFIQVCNAVARVADEWGDRAMDAGLHPEKGKFSINLFNQYNARLVAKVCQLSRIEDPDVVATLQAGIEAQDGELVTNILRNYIANLPPDFTRTHTRYIRLAMRVLEISHVNMQGDIALAGE
jgi:hypothetical protein